MLEYNKYTNELSSILLYVFHVYMFVHIRYVFLFCVLWNILGDLDHCEFQFITQHSNLYLLNG